MAKKEQEKERRKEIRREKRIAIRVTEDLHRALEERAYQGHATVSTVVVEAVVKFLAYKPPER